ncbi:hypothetical protein WA026_012805 [Henosepilachna vigintioctopunctata]|uniref:Replication protein A subunit n=1 Tax=Henosepilachna vigintioctopunctata TaxID=420089 RepID=A0AAW1TL86_9CUCU
MTYNLTEGCLETIMAGGDVSNPIIQILGMKKIQSGSSNKERFRLVVSDGKHTVSQAMLAAQNNEQILHAGDNTVVRVVRFISSAFNNQNSGKEQRILLLLEVDIVAPGNVVGRQIGSPVQLTDSKKNESAAPKKVPQQYAPKPNEVASTGYNYSGENNAPSLENQMVHPITSLSPYQNKWIIKARVTNKSAIRTWSNSRGEGKLFSMDLVDSSGEIRCTAFREQVDKYYDYVQVDKIYFISKCQLKAANKKFSSLKNDYEMTTTSETIIQECQSDDTAIPTTCFNFVTIDKISNMEEGALVDICAICKNVSDVQVFQAKTTGRDLTKRDVALVDQSNTSINLTLWGNEALSFDGINNPVVVIKGAKIGEFGGGKSLSCLSSTLMKINPDIPESFRIRGWYDQVGCNENVVDISAKSGLSPFSSPWLSFKEVKDKGLGNGDKADYYQTMATILLMRSENLTYKACPTESCNKKVIDLENGMFRCEKCNREYPNFKYRLLSSINMADWSGNTWVSTFTSEAETILGMTAQEVGEQIENNSEAAANIVERVNFKQFVFKCRAKMETYNDEARLKTIAVEVKPVHFKEYNNYLIGRIKQLMS